MARAGTRTLIAILAATLSAPLAAGAQGLASGPYLAARQAIAESDFQAATRYLSQGLMSDPSNPTLLEDAVVAYVSLGDMERAIAVARRLIAIAPDNQISSTVLLAETIGAGDFPGALEQLGDGEAVGTLVQGLITAWIQVGAGEMSAALVAFDAVSQQPGLKNFALYHKALALAMVGDLESAEAILSGAEGAEIPATRRGVIAHAEILSQLERNADAVALLQQTFGREPEAEIAALTRRLEAGETLPFTAIRNAVDGVAEVFFSFAGALTGEVNDNYILAYSRIAEYLRPDHSDALLMTAQILEKLGRHGLATKAYERIPPEDPAHFVAELGRAEALQASGNNDAAIEVLRTLSRTGTPQPEVFTALGDLFRRMERFAEASDAYDQAIAALDEERPEDWVIYYTRGISLERQDLWEQAEADFRKALALNPDQPQVLNYLGYSLVEKRTSLDEALTMITKAVAARPNDGYITDSLGWVQYRLGRYDEAVVSMELAAELTPVDPVINDHLGDVYWAVGRKREAEFQWQRALSLDPEEVDATRIRRKLEVGLDAVLVEEGADPIAVANDL